MAWRSFVAMGDSFTEGLHDPYPNGTFRGWADLVAARLAVDAGPDFGSANLAVRGRLLDQIIAEQLEPTLAIRPDLVSFAGGGNDVRRPRVDPHSLVERIDPVVARLRAAGVDVLLFRFADVTAHLPGQRIVGPAPQRSTTAPASWPNGMAPSSSTCSPTTPSTIRPCGAPTGCTCRRRGTAGSRGTC
jgi:lysophospholipase L1-like esterase